jgi:hypothetical protein
LFPASNSVVQKKKAPTKALVPSLQSTYYRKIVISGGRPHIEPFITVSKQFNVKLREEPNGNLAIQHTWLIRLAHVSLHDFQEKKYKMELTSSNSVLITMPTTNQTEMYGNLMCQDDASLLALATMRNQFASEVLENEYHIAIDFEDDNIENSFPLGAGKNLKHVVEPNLAGALLKMKKRVEVRVQVDSPMPDAQSSFSGRFRNSRSSPAPPSAHSPGLGNETFQVQVVEEEVVADRSCCITWSVGIKNTKTYIVYNNSGDEGATDLHSQKTSALCERMSMDDVTSHRTRSGMR